VRILPVAFLVAAAAAPLAAQTSAPLPIELGVDAALQTDDQTDVTTLSVPLQRVRVGFFLSPRLSFEPTLAFERGSGDGASGSALAAGAGVLVHLAGAPTGRARTTSLFVRPFAGLTRASFDLDDPDFDLGSESVTQASAGVGLGLKFPVMDRLAWRVEGTFQRNFETDDLPAANVLGLTVGLSFHTR
jgi:hypothetical protein